MSLKDINGKDPEIYICETNRSAGKTTYFSRWLVKRYINHREKFALEYRYVYEIDNVADKFFKDIEGLFYPGYVMHSKRDKSGAFHRLYLKTPSGKTGDECGYALALNSADALKKNSHLLSDTARIFFDEFQSESNHYCDNEIIKFQSIHASIARGGGQFVRRVPVIMCSNPVSLLNPYYSALGISGRLRDDTKFMRGDGWVLEHGHNEAAALAQEQSGFMRAFANDSYASYAVEGTYLNDNYAFIDTPIGKSDYIATLAYNGTYYGVRLYPDAGILYCDTSADKTYPVCIAVTQDAHDVGTVMARQFRNLILLMRYYYDKGCFRFRNLETKSCVLTLLSL